MIKEAFNIVDMEGKGHIDRKEVVYVMRYLLQFPSDAQMRDYILDFIKAGDDPADDYVKYSKFEPFMLDIMLKN